MKNYLRTIRSPFSVNYEVTPVCNLRCEFCLANSGKGFRHPSFEQVCLIIDELVRAEVFEIRLFGGEFFTYPRWASVVEYLYARGMFMSFVSNGTLITPEVVSTLMRFGIKDGAISIHGPKDIHDKITGIPGSYDRATGGLKACLEGGIKITVLTTITQTNKGRLPELIETLAIQGLIDEEKVTYGVNRLCPYGRGRKDWDERKLSLRDYLNLFPVLEKISQDYHIGTAFGDAFPHCLVPQKYHYLIQGCWQGTGFGHISANGNVRGCSTASGSFGNLLSVPLEKIWQGRGMRQFRKLVWLPEKCRACKEFCGGGCSASRPSVSMYAPDEFLEVDNENNSKV